MKYQRPEISIIIPVHNRGDLLAEVLAGLTRQTVDAQALEILVCDDGSTEDLTSVVGRFVGQLPGLRLLAQENAGPASARNLGTASAAAPLIMYLDSDVQLDTGLVEHLIQGMAMNPDWVGAEARVVPIDGQDNLLWDAPVCESGGVYLTAAIVYRTARLREVGGFDETYKRAACEDVELAARMLSFGPVGFVKEAVIEHPRRRRTFQYYWKKRHDWQYVARLAMQHGFLGWPGNSTNWPRSRVALASIVTQPLHRLRKAFGHLPKSPWQAGEIALHAIFGAFCGLCALGQVISTRATAPRDYLSGHSNNTRQSAAA